MLMKNIIFAAAECTPFIKTGGLGDVVGSLPKRLDQKRYRVSIVIPDYQCIDEKYKRRMKTEFSFPVHMNWRTQIVTVRSIEENGIHYYFLHNDFYYVGPSPYSDMSMDAEKFCFYSKAVLEFLAYLDYQVDIIHCHDWQAAMIPAFLKLQYGHDPLYQKIRTIVTIHNLKFQGVIPIDQMKDITGFSDDAFTYDKLEYYGSANMMKGGISFADKITTVSKAYAKEIQEPEMGEGLDQILKYRDKDLSGIVNGLDYDVYHPSKDPYLVKHYDILSLKAGKRKNKEALLDETGLAGGADAFTIGIIARLTGQKGIELLDPIFEELLDAGVQFAILGSGEQRLEEMLKWYSCKSEGKVYLNLRYSDPLAKLIYAGADAILMPSRFEPCGLSQLMAMRYGTVPIVRSTGGLKDTVEPYKNGKGTGFVFDDFDAQELKEAILEAKDVYDKEPADWLALARRDMRQNFSWDRCCKEYEKLYDNLLED